MSKIYKGLISAGLVGALALGAACNNTTTTTSASETSTPSVASSSPETTTTTSSAVNPLNALYEGDLTAVPISAFPAQFSEGINQVGFGALKDLYEAENLSLSPASIVFTMSMIQAGAKGETAEQIKKALYLDELSQQEIEAAAKQLMWRSNSNGMQAANAVWLDSQYSFQDTYLNTLTKNFMATAGRADFAKDPEAATQAINDWVKSQTNGKIPELNPEPLPADTAMALVNAMHFLGQWETPFDSALSKKDVFIGGKMEVEVDFMYASHSTLYAETPNYSMIALPFGEPTPEETEATPTAAESKESAVPDSKYAMAFILPTKEKDLREVAGELQNVSFATVTDSLKPEHTDISLPKFEFLYNAPLDSWLKEKGITAAFDRTQADFSGMINESTPLYLSSVLHQSFIKVDEKGAEAAAATQGIMTPVSAPVGEIKTFRADRPFIFVIYDQTDSTILFLGAVSQPS